MSPRAYAGLAIVALAALVLWRGGSALVEHGRMLERQQCQDAQERARERQDSDTVASETVADETRKEAAAAAGEARAATATTIETIRYVYRDQPAPACPPPAVPDGVRDALIGAYDAAAAAAR